MERTTYAVSIDYAGSPTMIAQPSKTNPRNGSKCVVMPMNTGTVPIKPGQVAMITSDAHKRGWIAIRLFISAAGTGGGARDWLVSSIRINGREKLKESISGSQFAVDRRWGDVRWKVRAGRRVTMIVNYIGRRKHGAPFFAVLMGQEIA